jgi:Site-specific recombinase XerD
MNAIHKRRDAFIECLNQRDRLIWSIGKDTGLRIGDILRLKRHEARKGTFTIIEHKTGKKKRCRLSEGTIRLFSLYVISNPARGRQFIFINHRTGKPFTRQAIWYNFHKAGERVRLNRTGTHSMRKTYAQLMMASSDIEHTRKALNHKSSSITAVYLKQRR